MNLPARAPYADVEVGEHRLALLKDGAQAFPAMLAAIAEAKSTICFETYIYKDDQTGRRFGEALMGRARAGVQVNFMFDGWGSSVSPDYLEELTRGGVRVVVYRPMRWSARLGALFLFMSRRNHRKSLVVDGEVAFLGGLNISDDYAALEDGGGGWRDTHLGVRGPAAVQLERMFLETWLANKGPALDTGRYARSMQGTDGLVRIFGNGLAHERKDVRREYVAAFNRAQRRVDLTHAYFLPPARVVRALKRAAQRGVQVRVVLAAATDVLAVLLAARGLYPKLLRAGIRVFEWEGRVLHAKTAVVDGQWSTVGSSNLDHMSLRVMLEVNAMVESPALAQALERMFDDDLSHCREVTWADVKARSPIERLLSWVAYQARHWL